MFKHKKNAFTLVELIVVITILAILGTVAFIGLQGYSKYARNSTRISDMKSIGKMFSFYHLRELSFPIPTNPEEVTFSGAKLWIQGTFGESTRSSIGSKGNISNIPLDPLTGSEYTYSLLNTGQEYGIATVFEGNLETNINLSNKSYAVGLLGSTYIEGNYNGQIAKVSTGSTEYILALPSIIKGQTIQTDILDIITSKNLTYNGSNNIPLSYSGTTNFENKTITDNIIIPSKLVVFEGNINDLRNSINTGLRQILISNLQDAYSGTLVSNQNSVEIILDVNTADTNAMESLAVTLLNNNFGGAILTNNIGGSTPTPLTDWRSIDSNCDIADITIGSQIWAGCNSTIGIGIEYGKRDDGTNGTVGNCYKNHQGTDITGDCVIDSILMASTTKSNTWFTGTNINGDSAPANIWGKYYTWDNAITACKDGYHLPTDAEWTTLENTLASTNCRTGDGWHCEGLGWENHNTKNTSNSIVQALKLPLSGHRHTDGSTFYGRGYYTYLWSSTVNGSTALDRGFHWNSSAVNRYSRPKARGFPVRCIKD